VETINIAWGSRPFCFHWTVTCPPRSHNCVARKTAKSTQITPRNFVTNINYFTVLRNKFATNWMQVLKRMLKVRHYRAICRELLKSKLWSVFVGRIWECHTITSVERTNNWNINFCDSNTFPVWHNVSLRKVKVKCTLVQALRLCTGCTAHRGSRDIALLFLDHGTREGWGVSFTHPAAHYPRERPGTPCIGGWVDPMAGLDGCGKSRPHRDSIPGPYKP